jgi:hypothetical protein
VLRQLKEVTQDRFKTPTHRFVLAKDAGDRNFPNSGYHEGGEQIGYYRIMKRKADKTRATQPNKNQDRRLFLYDYVPDIPLDNSLTHASYMCLARFML